MAKIAQWIDCLGALTEPPEGRNDRRYAGHDCGWAIGDERDRSGGDSQRVHRFERALGTVAEQANGSCWQLTLGRQLVPERGQLGFGGQPAMPISPEPIWVESRMRCDSPPDSVPDLRLKLR